MYLHLNCTCILPLLIPFQYNTIKTRVGHAEFFLCVAVYAHWKALLCGISGFSHLWKKCKYAVMQSIYWSRYTMRLRKIFAHMHLYKCLAAWNYIEIKPKWKYTYFAHVRKRRWYRCLSAWNLITRKLRAVTAWPTLINTSQPTQICTHHLWLISIVASNTLLTAMQLLSLEY